MHTTIELIKRTTAFFSDKGLDSPRLDAQILLSHALGCTRTDLYAHFDRPIVAAELDSFRELVRRRATGEPVAYIVGTREFWSLSFKVGPGVLIPRPDTERLVELALSVIPDRSAPLRVADVGTGSGCIACALASELPNAKVVAIDVSVEALELARENVACHGFSDRISLVRGETLGPFAGRRGCLDLIVSNPPYVTTAEFDALPPTVREFEPRGALVAGTDGLDVVRDLARSATELLAADGYLLFEIGYQQGAAATALARRFFDGGPDAVRLEQDYGGNDRVVVCRRGDDT